MKQFIIKHIRISLIVLFLTLVIWVSELRAYNLVFQSGFEGDIDFSPRSGSTTYFKTCASQTCLNNRNYCTIGCTDPETGFNMPADIPGRYRVTGNSPTVINHVQPDERKSEIAINTNPAYVKNGSQSMRWKVISGGSSNRNQLNIYDENGGNDYDDMDETCVKYWVYIDMPSHTGPYCFNEWRGTGNRLTFYSGGIQYAVGGNTCNVDTDDCINNTNVLFPLQTWVEVLIYQRNGEGGGDGRFIFKYMEEGMDPVTVFDWVGKNNYDGEVSAYNVIKQYCGGATGVNMYIDDLRWYDVSGPSDLPDFTNDTTAPAKPTGLSIIE